ISKSPAYKIVISQLDEFVYSDSIDMILKVGTDHHSLIGKFSITYIFEVLEALYHLKYGVKEKREL
ncbi:MurR/RpiR family transcriptional regulator, partial [Erysipelatoclostridium ramosum]|nr:MurR/RpiR family transcriptional regulator [Thomasclavelia ramosa]